MDTMLGMFGGGNEGFTPFSESRAQEHYRDLYLQERPRHEASWTHEGIAAAAGFAAMHAYESHLRATGQEVSHGKMKELLAAIAAAEVDKLVETKGLDWVDKHRAKKLAEHQAHALAQQRYGDYNTGWEYATSSAQQQGPAPAREYDFYGGAPWGAQGCPSYGWYDQRHGGGGYGGPGYGSGGYGGYEGGPGYGGGGYGAGYSAGGYPQQQGYPAGGYGQEYYEGPGYNQGPPRGYGY